MPEMVRWDGRKWPDRRHWQFMAERLGRDEHGTWLHVRAGTEARRDRERHVLPVAFVILVPEGTWWTAEFYRSHAWHQVYANIGTPCEWRGSAVRQVDLDLDVVRTNEGDVRVLDEDEFADHQQRFGYPQQLIAAARAAADEVAELIASHREPFGRASLPWLDRAAPPAPMAP